MVENQVTSLTSNWGTLGDADLLSVIMRSNTDDAEINLDEMTTDNCVCLVRKYNRDNSKGHLEIKVNGYIKNIILISEAQVIEVFGVNDEYLLTYNAEFFDDWEGMAVYYSKICVPSIPVCRLKFTRIRNEERIWIYGAKIQVQSKVNHHTESPVNFNIEQISRLLSNTNLTNINSGNNIKNLLQFYFKNLPNNNFGYFLGKKQSSNDVHTNTSITHNQYHNSISHNGSNQENGVTETLSRLQVNESGSVDSQKTSSKPPSTNNNWLVNYIDQKLDEIKTEILCEVDIKINNLREETNHKLDRIISFLETGRTETYDIK